MDGITAPQFGEILEQGKQTAANAVKNVINDTTNTVSGQIGLKNESGVVSNQQARSQNQVSNTDVSSATGSLDGGSNEQTAEMIRDFYSPSSDAALASARPKNQEEYETQQKLLKVRQSLHDETYYNPLFAYEHKKEERPAEVAEKEEEQKKMMELEQKKQDDNNTPIALKRAQMSTEHRDQGGAG